jgi:hypothetical protein
MAIIFTLLLFAILAILSGRRQSAEAKIISSSNQELLYCVPNFRLRIGDSAELYSTLGEGQDLSLADSKDRMR